MYNPKDYPELSDAQNYCRNLDGVDKPWCYVNHRYIRWEYCDIEKCDTRKSFAVFCLFVCIKKYLEYCMSFPIVYSI